MNFNHIIITIQICFYINVFYISEPKAEEVEERVDGKMTLEPLATVSSLMKTPSPTRDPVEQPIDGSAFEDFPPRIETQPQQKLNLMDSQA